MGLGGPVWHASAAPLVGLPFQLGEEFLERKALEELDGVGDASLGEWREWTGRAFHIRRRLTADEQALVGPAVDVRGTAEARQRFYAAYSSLPAAARMVAKQELSEVRT